MKKSASFSPPSQFQWSHSRMGGGGAWEQGKKRDLVFNTKVPDGPPLYWCHFCPLLTDYAQTQLPRGVSRSKHLQHSPLYQCGLCHWKGTQQLDWLPLSFVCRCTGNLCTGLQHIRVQTSIPSLYGSFLPHNKRHWTQPLQCWAVQNLENYCNTFWKIELPQCRSWRRGRGVGQAHVHNIKVGQ